MMTHFVRRLVMCALLIVGSIFMVRAQRLPAPVAFSGIVTDADGKPLRGVWVGNRQLVEVCKSDEQGRFEGKTSEPVIVFRKIGYRSFRFRVEVRAGLQITLLPAPRTVPSCETDARCTSLKGWSSKFCFPPVSGVQLGDQGEDVDYGMRFLYTNTPTGDVGIRHGAGPMWTFGLPSETLVWNSVEFSETVYRRPDIGSDHDEVALGLIDARGTLQSGKHWRWLGTFGESADYQDVGADTAKLLDKVLDEVCIRKNP